MSENSPTQALLEKAKANNPVHEKENIDMGAVEEMAEDDLGLEIIKQDEDGDLIVPDFDDIGKMKTADLKTLYSELLVTGTLKAAIDGFDKLKIADKRTRMIEELTKVIEGTDGAEEVEDDLEEAEEEQEETEAEPEPEVPTVVKEKPHQEVLDADELHQFAHEVENITDQKKLEGMVKDLRDQQEFNIFKIGGCLAIIHGHPEWWGEFEGEQVKFADYVKELFGLEYRPAMYYIAVYTGMIECNLTWEQVKNVGWTKLMKLLPILTADNADGYLKKVAEDDMTVKQVEALVKSVKGEEPGQIEGPKTVTKTLKLHDDQLAIYDEALEAAKEAAGTDVDTVAVEYIMTQYLGNDAGTETQQAVLPTGHSSEDVAGYFKAILDASSDKNEAIGTIFEGFEAVFPDVNVTVEGE